MKLVAWVGIDLEKSKQGIYYVYALLDPRVPGPFRYGNWTFSHEPFYIGKGKGQRMFMHTKKRGGRNPHKTRKIESIRRSGLEPLAVVKKSLLTEEQAFDLEIRLINKVGRHNLKSGPLVNLTDGGDGITGRVVTRKTRKNNAEATRKQMAQMTPEQRIARSERISEGLKLAYASGRRDALESGRKTSKTKCKRGSFFDRMTPEEQKSYSAARSNIAKATQAQIRNDPVRLAQFRANVGLSSLIAHTLMTEKTKKTRVAKISSKAKEQWAARSVEERAAIAQKSANTQLSRSRTK